MVDRPTKEGRPGRSLPHTARHKARENSKSQRNSLSYMTQPRLRGNRATTPGRGIYRDGRSLARGVREGQTCWGVVERSPVESFGSRIRLTPLGQKQPFLSVCKQCKVAGSGRQEPTERRLLYLWGDARKTKEPEGTALRPYSIQRQYSALIDNPWTSSRFRKLPAAQHHM